MFQSEQQESEGGKISSRRLESGMLTVAPSSKLSPTVPSLPNIQKTIIGAVLGQFHSKGRIEKKNRRKGQVLLDVHISVLSQFKKNE
jgi:hypothetical protein